MCPYIIKRRKTRTQVTIKRKQTTKDNKNAKER